MFAFHQLPNNFIKQMVACGVCFKNFQIEAVREHLSLYQNRDIELKNHLERIKTMVVNEYVQRYAVAKIPLELTITKMVSVSFS